MAIIENISANKEGCLSIKDNVRPYPVSICTDAANDFIYYIRKAKDPVNKARFERLVGTLKAPISRYVLKLAIDNSDRADEIIDKIESDIRN